MTTIKLTNQPAAPTIPRITRLS